MKKKWFEKRINEAVSVLKLTNDLICGLKDEQQDKLDNYPEKFIDTPNY